MCVCSVGPYTEQVCVYVCVCSHWGKSVLILSKYVCMCVCSHWGKSVLILSQYLCVYVFSLGQIGPYTEPVCVYVCVCFVFGWFVIDLSDHRMIVLDRGHFNLNVDLRASVFGFFFFCCCLVLVSSLRSSR